MIVPTVPLLPIILAYTMVALAFFPQKCGIIPRILLGFGVFIAFFMLPSKLAEIPMGDPGRFFEFMNLMQQNEQDICYISLGFMGVVSFIGTLGILKAIASKSETESKDEGSQPT